MPSTDEIIPYLRQIDESKWYSNFGPLNDQLISRLSSYFHVSADNLCLIGNATLGLQAVAELLDIQPSTIFEVPSFTFAASPSALIAARKNLRFIDVDQNMRCTPTQNSKAVMDVLPFGDSLRTADWMKSLDFLIVDAAASFDALKNFGKNVDFGCEYAIVVSLHSTKLLGAGEGGIVISSSSDLIDNIKKWQNFGFDIKNTSRRVSTFSGTNAKMSEFSCAIGLASLDRWKSVRARYLAIQSKALEISTRHKFEVHSAMRSGFANPYWIIRTSSEESTRLLIKQCRDLNIETRLWWQSGCHQMPAFADIDKVELINTNFISKTYLGLPFHLYLNDENWNLLDQLLSKVRESSG
jgi:dTDP-4-amino-4,6-dideoxygalactose transaminase